jgi:hypothetical protein
MLCRLVCRYYNFEKHTLSIIRTVLSKRWHLPTNLQGVRTKIIVVIIILNAARTSNIIRIHSLNSLAALSVWKLLFNLTYIEVFEWTPFIFSAFSCDVTDSLPLYKSYWKSKYVTSNKIGSVLKFWYSFKSTNSGYIQTLNIYYLVHMSLSMGLNLSQLNSPKIL